MSLLKIGIWILLILQLLVVLELLFYEGTLDVYMGIFWFVALFDFFTLLLLLAVLRRIERLERKKPLEIPKSPE